MTASGEDSEIGEVLGVVLAAGAGSRYGMPKILAHDGVWLKASTNALRAGGCADVAVAMGAAIVAPPVGVTALVVDDWADGLGASVSAALGWASRRPGVGGVVLTVVDTPDVGPEVVRRIVDASGGRRGDLVRAVFDGRRGHPVYIGADHLGPAVEVIHGDVGAQRYLRDHEVTCVECGDLATGRDIDTRE
ncbi:molybdopterin-guanine dinucleotide biosynthesis protein MobA [Gordonia alkanivorans]|uniref:nucleotidyltransferase family protein n=1 Tax=Gordonia alkanivorans TaxID=84096 RepID=UPI000FDE2E12|nr:NTP transferase domain-containing protein [Gordonia alkanivorans]AZZ82861.1 molybdopterin-guanine dinucleotide biosynthesis protein MobA [Gordonia alkanivorans]